MAETDEAAPLELVVAVSENDVIGRDNALPWRLPADLRRFKSLTLGKTIIMGRRTFESIGRPLPGRTNVILTRSASFAAAGCAVVHSLHAGRHAARAEGSPLMVIGGAELYRQCMPYAGRVHLTLVHAIVPDGDTFFDGWRDPTWMRTAVEPHAAEGDAPAFTFMTLERTAPEAQAPG